MAIEVYEIRGRGFEDQESSKPADTESSFRRMWRIEGTNDDNEARQALLNTRPATSHGIPVFGHRLREIGPNIYEGEVEYSTFTIVNSGGNDLRKTLEEGQWRISVTATTTTQHITHGLEIVEHQKTKVDAVRQRYATDNTGAAINVNFSDPDSPTVDGIDVLVPAISFKLTMGSKHGSEFFNMRRYGGYVATKNSHDFFGFEPGELLYLGYTLETSSELVQESPERAIEITHEFDVSFTINQLKLGRTTRTGVPQLAFEGRKEGWDYLSIVTVPWQKKGEVAPFPAIVQGDIIRIYERSDFRELFGFFTP